MSLRRAKVSKPKFTCPLCGEKFYGPTEAAAIVKYEDHDCPKLVQRSL